MAKRTTIVRLPNGGVDRRTSETKTYTHAVLCISDRRAEAAGLRAEADEWQEMAELAQKIVASGDLSQFAREHTRTNGAGWRGYSSRVPGNYPHHWLPDWQDAASWAEYAEGALARMAAEPAKLRAEADKLDAGPAMGCGIVRWSQSAANADAGRREFERRFEGGRLARCTRFTVVECEESRG